MELVQGRIVTGDVEKMANFYAALVGARVVLNDYYVEVPTTAARVALSRMRFTDFEKCACGPPRGVAQGDVILDFAVDDVDAEFQRVGGLGVDWVMLPTLQPWGRKSMMLRDPEGHLVNIFSKTKEEKR